jgi:hypothetical protein
MCANRVEELEARVNELEASVEGLTDELVECKVRIRELEAAVDEDLGFVPGGAVESGNEADGSGEIRTQKPGESPDDSEEAEATKTAGSDGEDNTEDSESDIIVA